MFNQLKSDKTERVASRRLRFESLENRQLLSATPVEILVGAAASECVAAAGFTDEAIDFSCAMAAQELASVAVDATLPHVGARITAETTPAEAVDLVNFQWYRVTEVGDVAIDGATANFYEPTAEDVGCVLKVVATGAGGYEGTQEATTAVAVLATNPLQLSTTNPRYGHRISSTLTPVDTFATYQWYAQEGTDWQALDGHIVSYLTPSYSDVGKALRLVATYQRGEYAGLNCEVTTSAVVRSIPSLKLIAPDNPTVGSKLTAEVWQIVTADFQWYRVDVNGVRTAIAGATAKTYVATEADSNCYLEVEATGTGFFDGVVTRRTARRVDETIFMTLSTLDPLVGYRVAAQLSEDVAATYQWYAGASAETMAPIAGATAKSLPLGVGYLGQYLRCEAVITEGEFAGELVSATTNKVRQEVSRVTIDNTLPCVGAYLTSYTTPAAATAGATYQWYRVTENGETAVQGATTRYYDITDADVGCYLKVVATGTGDYVGTVEATTTVPVLATNPLQLSTVDPRLGVRITSTLTPVDTHATYQWYAKEGNRWRWLDGHTVSYFSPSYNNVGEVLRLVATYQQGQYAGLKCEAITNKVVRSIPGITLGAPEYITVGSKLTGVVWQIVTADFQWYRVDADGVRTAINGATDKTYFATEEDVSYYLEVEATGTGVFDDVVSARTVDVVNSVAPPAAAKLDLDVDLDVEF